MDILYDSDDWYEYMKVIAKNVIKTIEEDLKLYLPNDKEIINEYIEDVIEYLYEQSETLAEPNIKSLLIFFAKK